MTFDGAELCGAAQRERRSGACVHGAAFQPVLFFAPPARTWQEAEEDCGVRWVQIMEHEIALDKVLQRRPGPLEASGRHDEVSLRRVGSRRRCGTLQASAGAGGRWLRWRGRGRERGVVGGGEACYRGGLSEGCAKGLQAASAFPEADEEPGEVAEPLCEIRGAEVVAGEGGEVRGEPPGAPGGIGIVAGEGARETPLQPCADPICTAELLKPLHVSARHRPGLVEGVFGGGGGDARPSSTVCDFALCDRTAGSSGR